MKKARQRCTEKMRTRFFDLRSEPFECDEETFKYNDWFIERNFLL